MQLHYIIWLQYTFLNTFINEELKITAVFFLS